MEQRLYDDRAELYDAIYASKPYAAEAERLHGLLAREGIADGSRILEAACGTGSYLRPLGQWYEVAGLDRSAAVLRIARDKLGAAVPLLLADMADFSVARPFDALLCLFSSIAYLHTEPQLAGAAARFAAALRPGGLLVVEPFVTPEQFHEGSSWLQAHDGEALKCARACVPRRSGELAVLDFHWLVARQGSEEVEHFVERHELWLAPHERIAGTIAAAGFSVRIEAALTPGRPLLVARRR